MTRAMFLGFVLQQWLMFWCRFGTYGWSYNGSGENLRTWLNSSERRAQVDFWNIDMQWDFDFDHMTFRRHICSVCKYMVEMGIVLTYHMDVFQVFLIQNRALFIYVFKKFWLFPIKTFFFLSKTMPFKLFFSSLKPCHFAYVLEPYQVQKFAV